MATLGATAIFLGMYDRKRTPVNSPPNISTPFLRGHWPQPAGEVPSTWPEPEYGVTSFTFVPGDVNVSTDRITEAAHGMNNGQKVRFRTTGTMPYGLAAVTDYYVVNKNANDFQVSRTEGGTAVNITTQGTGTHTCNKINKIGGVYVPLPSAPWHRFQKLGEWILTAPISGATFQVSQTAVRRGSTGVVPVVRGAYPSIEATSGNWTYEVSFRCHVKRRNLVLMEKRLREQKRDLYDLLRAWDSAALQVGDASSAPTRPEGKFEEFTGDYLKDALVFWDGHKTSYPTPATHPYHNKRAYLEAFTTANVVYGATEIAIAHPSGADAWELGFRPGMVCSIGQFDLDSHPFGANGHWGTELFKIADIQETTPGNGVWTKLTLAEPIRRPAVGANSYTAGMHIRGFTGLYRKMRLDSITVEAKIPGRLVVLSYNFTVGADPLLIDLDECVPFSTRAATFTATVDPANLITSTAHALQNNDRVVVYSSGTLPGGLNSLGRYYVVNRTADTFQLSLTQGGAPVTITTTGTGTHTWLYYDPTTGGGVPDGGGDSFLSQRWP